MHVSQMKERFLARGYPKTVANNQIKLFLVDTSLLRKIWKVVFLFLLPNTLPFL